MTAQSVCQQMSVVHGCGRGDDNETLVAPRVPDRKAHDTQARSSPSDGVPFVCSPLCGGSRPIIITDSGQLVLLGFRISTPCSNGTTTLALQAAASDDYACDPMIDNIRNDTETAAARLVTRLSALFRAEMERLRSTAVPPGSPTIELQAPSSPEDAEDTDAATAEPPPSSRRVPLSQRANVYRMPTGAPLPPRTNEESREGEADAPSEIGPADLADAAVRAVTASAEPLGLEQIRAKLKVSREALTAVLDGLVADGRLRKVEQDGSAAAYKPPRIEPIKRARSQMA